MAWFYFVILYLSIMLVFNFVLGNGRKLDNLEDKIEELKEIVEER